MTVSQAALMILARMLAAMIHATAAVSSAVIWMLLAQASAKPEVVATEGQRHQASKPLTTVPWMSVSR